jgi:NIPSNAP protein
MVRWMRSARIKGGGKFVEAVTWAKEIAAFAEKKYSTPRVNVYVDAVGHVGTIRWMIDYGDLAEFEKVQAQALRDPEYFAKLKEAESKALFVEGEMEDVMTRPV